MNTSSRQRAHAGWPLLAAGFRPFFLLGSIYAGLAILVWLPLFYGELTLLSAFSPRDWHVHEMLYGYLPAVITGFLFTAIPNWTGRLPIQGTPLLVLVIVWIAGRLCVTFSAETGWLAAMLVDAGFLSLSPPLRPARFWRAATGKISVSWRWSCCCLRAMSRFTSRRIFMAPPIPAFASASPWWCC